jgi:hypothetical protein
MADRKITRAELAEAVRELREEVARLRAEQAHACHCGHVCITVPVVVPPPPPPVPLWVQPYQITCDTAGINPHPTTSVAAGCPPTVSYPVPGYQMDGGGSVVSSGYTVSASN